MKIEDVKIGMKVVPHKKSVGDDQSSAWNRIKRNGQPFLYVVALSKEDGHHKVQLWDAPGGSESGFGDWFLASDFDPYVEPETAVPLPHNIRVEQVYAITDECGVVLSRHDTLGEAIWAQTCKEFEEAYDGTDGIWGGYHTVDAESVRHWILDNEDAVRALLDARAAALEAKK